MTPESHPWEVILTVSPSPAWCQGFHACLETTADQWKGMWSQEPCPLLCSLPPLSYQRSCGLLQAPGRAGKLLAFARDGEGHGLRDEVCQRDLEEHQVHLTWQLTVKITIVLSFSWEVHQIPLVARVLVILISGHEFISLFMNIFSSYS